ncbi:MAG: helix-turn-helix transcriptional regulator [Alkalispirochaeta sp.]
MSKRYSSISEVVNDFIDDQSFRERFEQEIGDKRVAKTLFAIRARSGKSQQEMAGLLGCTPDAISRLENSRNDEVTVRDLVSFAHANELSLTIAFYAQPSARGYDEVK